MDFSDDARELLSSFIGYRSYNYGRVGAHNAVAIIGHEGLLEDAEDALGIPNREHESDFIRLDIIRAEIGRRFGRDAIAIWIASSKGVRNYLKPDEKPTMHRLPKSALLITDLGQYGQLFIVPKRDWLAVNSR